MSSTTNPTSSPSNTVIKPGSTAAIVDAAGHRWTISATNAILQDAKAAGFTANVAEIAYVNGVVWHENTSSQWYAWNGTGWTAGANPLPAIIPTPSPSPTVTPMPAASPNAAVVTAGSGKVITDAGNHKWTISSANAVLEDGKAAGFTANVAEIAYVNKTVWHENTAGQWYAWNGTGWTGAANPLPVSTPQPTPKPSANNTVVLAGSVGTIVDATGNKWTITAAGQVAVNGTTDSVTANVIELAYVNGAVWQENRAKLWWGKTSPAATWGPNAGTATSPLPPAITPTPSPSPTVTPMPAASPNDTVVTAGSGKIIVDAGNHKWTISSANAVLEDGNAAGFTANVAEIAYVNNTVWHENTSSQWYAWNGSGWTPGIAPLSGGGGNTGGSGTGNTPAGSGNAGSITVGSALNLGGYHLTFDWEANDFPNNPTPKAGSFATTLSDGLRYLSNGDQQYWADSSTGQNPFKLDDGALDINATYVGSGNTPGGGSLSYVSGVFTTQGWYSQQYGYFEMRAQLPAGVGMWPAFWMLDDTSNQPGGWPPELDALETFGAPNAGGEGGTNQAHFGVHSHNTSQESAGWVTLTGDESTSYHTYGVLWTPTKMTFIYDGKALAQAPTPSDYTQKMYMIVNLAVGGTWPGYANGENGTMKVDYLRAFSSDAALPAVALQTVSSPDGGGKSLYGATSKAAAVMAAASPSVMIPPMLTQ